MSKPTNTSRRKLVTELKTFALRNTEATYDEKSRTHIVYCLQVGKLGTRAAGAFADEAWAEFTKQLNATIRKATIEDLKRWIDKLQNPDKYDPSKQPPKDPDRTITKSFRIGTDLLCRLQESSLQKGKSIDLIAADILTSGMQELNEAAERIASKRIKEEISTAAASETSKLTIDMNNRLHAQLLLLSKEFDLKCSDLMQYFLRTDKEHLIQ